MSEKRAHAVCLTTVGKISQAKRLARTLVANRLVACVNLAPVTSVYSWQGKICENGETLLIMKTRQALVKRLREFIEKAHPYDTPEFVAWPLSGGLKKYLKWINAVTA